MPRDGSGIYSKASASFVAATTIASAAVNSDFDDLVVDLNTPRPITAGGTGGSSQIAGWDGLTAKGGDIPSASSINLTTASGPRIDITGTTTITAVTLANGSWRLARATGIFVLTASASLVVNKSASISYTTAVGDLMIFTAEGGVTSVSVIGSSSTATPQGSTPVNLALAASVATSALTIALKGVDGNNPSASNPVVIPFPNVSAGNGTPAYLTITAATSLVISSGSTMGTTSAVAATLAVVMFNDAGTARLGLINPLVLPLVDGIASSTAEGGAGAADSAGVFYTGTAVTSKAYTVIGYLTATEATAGTWATAPSNVQVASAPAVNNALPTASPGLVKLTSGSVSSAATLEIVLSSYTGYRGFEVEIDSIIPATDAVDLLLRTSANGGSSYDSGASNYFWSDYNAKSSGTSGSNGSATDTSITTSLSVGNGSAEGADLRLSIKDNLNTAKKQRVHFTSAVYGSDDILRAITGSGLRNAAGKVDALRFLFSSGNIASAVYTVYGRL